MYLFAFSPNFLWAFTLDAIIIGVLSNAFYAGRNVLIPDLVDMERRGRANGIVQIITLFASMLPTVLTLIINEFYSTQTATGTVITHEGYILSFAFGALAIIVVAILGFLFIKEKPVSELPPRKKFMDDLRKTIQYKEFRKNKHFFRIIVALTVFNVGIRIILPFIWNYFFSLSLSTIGLILLFGISLPVAIVIMYVLGKIADKYGRKRFLAPSILISSIGFFIIPFFSPDTFINVIIYIVAFTLILIALMGLLVPLNTWRQDLLPEHERGKYDGIQNIMDTVSQIPGAIIGGLVADAFGIQWIFIVVPIFLIGSIPFFMTVKETLLKNVKEDLPL
jgi:MFS family permease